MKRYSILSVGVDAISAAEFDTIANLWLAATVGGHRIVTVNPEFIVEAQNNVRFRDVLNTADCNLSDGVGLEYASRFLFGRQVFFRMTGVSATLALCNSAARLGKSVYLVGARSGVAERTGRVLAQKFPGLSVAGAEIGIPIGGTRTPTEYTDELVGRINAQKPDILFVAFGAPKAELWIADTLSRMPSVKIAIGVGGTFDYLSGVVAYAPLWMRNVGLEWLYRLIKEPRRLNRIITATVRFPFAVVCSGVRRRKS